MTLQSRRKFIQFLGHSSLMGTMLFDWGVSMANPLKSILENTELPFNPIQPSDEDKLILADGFEYKTLIKAGDLINNRDFFGENNDFLAFIPLEGRANEALLWVNHEYFQPLFVTGDIAKEDKTQEMVKKEMLTVGGSILHLRKNSDNEWKFIKDSEYNRRITALTPIPFAWDEPIAGKTEAMGTLANCAGGLTPWGSVLTCEENYDLFWGERNFSTGERTNGLYGWEKFYDCPPEHYGWVVEVNPLTGAAKKLVVLGRCAHECATVYVGKDNCVVYSGDDAAQQCLYKFISTDVNSLSRGKLYVANLEEGRWIWVDYDNQPILKENFKSQTEVLVRLREAAKLLGGTPLDRPEDIEIDPKTGHILVSLTNNIPKGNYMGSILKIKEKGNDKTALEFSSEVMLTGGEETGFACPDNMAFDKKGNLWFTSDIPGNMLNKSPYKKFKNNGLFYVPLYGLDQGIVFQIASAPTDAEFTGPYFSEDGDTLFLCVQHPGETSKGLKKGQLTSQWPDYTEERPKSAVLAIQGRSLIKLLN